MVNQNFACVVFRHKSAVILQHESTDLLTGSSVRLGTRQSTMYTLISQMAMSGLIRI